MRVLTLDLGRMTGWCLGNTEQIGVAPDWGVWELAGAKALDASFLGLYNELTDKLDETRPRYVVYESPLTQSGRDSSRNIVDFLVGLPAVVRLTCQLREHVIPCYEQSFAEVRALVIGKGTFRKPFLGNGKINPKSGKVIGDAKEEVRIWTENYGWSGICDSDARDAAILYRYTQMISAARR